MTKKKYISNKENIGDGKGNARLPPDAVNPYRISPEVKASYEKVRKILDEALRRLA
ncbi:hypothetical protein [Xanthobacter variabilis]|uniref:hypothetical protein n=1 Tax=Xanthobacter variabilis TaxID=3119932 RepID=UPI00372A2DB8